MEQEQTMVHIHITDGGTGLTIGAHVRQFIVGAESLTVGCGTDTTRDIVFLRHDIVPDGINGLDIVLVTSEGCHIGHTCIHIGGTHGMTHGLILINDGLVSL